MSDVPPTDRAEGPTPELAARQARALGDPTRFALFRWLVHHGRLADVATLAELVSIHPNAVRRHLRTLVDAELAVESVATPTGRGRPRHHFAAAPDHADPEQARLRYAELARLLAEAVRTGASAREVGRRAGERSASSRGQGGDGTELDALVDQLADWGFAPEVEPPHGPPASEASIVLRACPFAEAADDEPAAICDLHHGLVEGYVEGASHLALLGLVVRPPAERACKLRLATRGLPPGPPPPPMGPTG